MAEILEKLSLFSKCWGEFFTSPRHALFLALALPTFGFQTGAAEAQTPLLKAPIGNGGETVAELPDDLTPDQIDGLLARLTDADIRRLLADELRERADDQAEDDMNTAEAIAYVGMRLGEMWAEISKKVPEWIGDVLNIRDRADEVAARIDGASDGLRGIAIAIAMIVAVGGGTAMTAAWLTVRPRQWLHAVDAPGYWEKVIRSALLGLVEMLPVVVFVAATRFALPFTTDMLGRIGGYFAWVYPVGISYSWGAAIIARRAFAPDNANLRIAPMDDRMADYVYRTIRRAALAGAATWLLANMFRQIGLGFPPAILTMAIGGTAVAGILLYAALTRTDDIRAAAETVAGDGAFGRLAAAGAPWAPTGYVTVAWLFWLAHFLETRTQHLYGPVGTLVVFIALPIFDRLGKEIVHSLLRRESPMSARFREVFRAGWRVLIGLCAAVLILDLWGLDLIASLQSPMMHAWVGTLVDMLATLLIVWFIWRLIKAALHQDRKFVAAGENFDPMTAPKATRLDTLTPLFRGVLLAFVVAIGLMFGLASLGVDIGPLLASAGIIGIAVGFGAQALVRDIFSGMFFLIDDAFRVGDYIELSTELRGDVETISIRSLQLRHHRGPVITIPFGEMKNITNHTRDWVLYKMPFRMEPDTEPQKFKKIVKNIGKEFAAHPEHGPKFIEPLKSQGVYYVDDDSALVFRVKFKCKPRAQFVLRREIYHRLREAFDAEGFRLARRKVEVVSNSANDEEIGLPEDMLTDNAN